MQQIQDTGKNSLTTLIGKIFAREAFANFAKIWTFFAKDLKSLLCESLSSEIPK